MLFLGVWKYGLGMWCNYGVVRIGTEMNGPEEGVAVFAVLNVMCFHCFGWIVTVSFCAVVVLLSKLN